MLILKQNNMFPLKNKIVPVIFALSIPLYSCGTNVSDANTADNVTKVDICIYGGNSSGIIAAYTAKKQGKSVIVIEPSNRIGGLTTGGLGQTDIGKVEIIKGYALDFYRRVGLLYGKSESVFQFEPNIALKVYQQYIQEAGLNILYNHRIVEAKKNGSNLECITVEDVIAKGMYKNVIAKVFIDCSYEGDLMAKAGVSYTLGRESISKYGESYNGVQMLGEHQFPDGVDPYCVKGKPSSGLLWGISNESMGTHGEADNHIQAYNFRITLTDDPNDIIPITCPNNYDPSKYELMLRLNDVKPWKSLNDIFIWSHMPNHKTDINNRNGFSTDMIGANYDYPDGSYEMRERIFNEHLDYTKGMLYFVGHDKRVPEFIRKEMLLWGYPKDEYEESDHFTPQLYIREARRMIGRMVMTQDYCQGTKVANDPIGWAAYTMDLHNCGRYVVNGMVKNEGDVEIGVPGPYNISYRAITPKETECRNLLVPVCLSASHIAYGSIRMEPVFMVLGETSALAAIQAIDYHGNCVQKVKPDKVMSIFEKI